MRGFRKYALLMAGAVLFRTLLFPGMVPAEGRTADIDRSELKFRVAAFDTGEGMADVIFELKCKETGERHVIRTDQDGFFLSSAVPHTVRTNELDAIAPDHTSEEEDDAEQGKELTEKNEGQGDTAQEDAAQEEAAQAEVEKEEAEKEEAEKEEAVQKGVGQEDAVQKDAVQEEQEEKDGKQPEENQTDVKQKTGIWFALRADQIKEEPDDQKGALPCGEYVLNELPCEANVSFELIKNYSFSIENSGKESAEAAEGTSLTDSGVPLLDLNNLFSFPKSERNESEQVESEQSEPEQTESEQSEPEQIESEQSEPKQIKSEKTGTAAADAEMVMSETEASESAEEVVLRAEAGVQENNQQEEAEAAEEKKQPEEAEAAEEKKQPEEAEAAEEKKQPEELEAAEEKKQPEEAEAAEEKKQPEELEAAEEKRYPETAGRTKTEPDREKLEPDGKAESESNGKAESESDGKADPDPVGAKGDKTLVPVETGDPDQKGVFGPAAGFLFSGAALLMLVWYSRYRKCYPLNS